MTLVSIRERDLWKVHRIKEGASELTEEPTRPQLPQYSLLEGPRARMEDARLPGHV